MTVPDCPTCHQLLGLYYAECATCFCHASDFTFADYDDDTNPATQARDEDMRADVARTQEVGA